MFLGTWAKPTKGSQEDGGCQSTSCGHLPLVLAPTPAVLFSSLGTEPLACPRCRDIGRVGGGPTHSLCLFLTVALSPSVSPIDPFRFSAQDHNPHGTKVPCTCYLHQGFLCLLLVPVCAVPEWYRPGPHDVFCSIAAVGIDHAAQLRATQRDRRFFFLVCRDEKWYPDLARCDGSCRISLLPHTHISLAACFLPSIFRLRPAAAAAATGSERLMPGQGRGKARGPRPGPHLAGPRAHFVMLTNRLTAAHQLLACLLLSTRPPTPGRAIVDCC